MSAEKNHVLFLFYFTTYIIQDDNSRKRSFKAGVDDTARNDVQVTWSQERVGQSTRHLPMRQVHALCRTKLSVRALVRAIETCAAKRPGFRSTRQATHLSLGLGCGG